MGLTDFEVLSFDCYGTLIDWESGILGALEPWLAAAGKDLDRDRILSGFGDAEPRVEAANPGALYPEILSRVHGELALEWGIEPSPDDAAAFGASVGDWPAFADTPEALAYLKQHYKLVILSNVDRASFGRSQLSLGVAFDAVFTAQDIGGYKPDPRNFHFMLDRLAGMGIKRSQVLHVAQSLYHDHVPAKALGLKTCWIDRRHDKGGAGATKAPPGDIKPDFTATSMAGLVERHKAALLADHE